MTSRERHVIGIDPGGTTGWALLTVDVRMLTGEMQSKILAWDYDEITGDENEQVNALCRLAREVQGLTYKIGPALVVEDFDVQPYNPTTSPEMLSPVRLAAKLDYAAFRGELGDCKIVMQGRRMAKDTATDHRLHKWGLWVEGSDDIRDAVRHAMTALRRARDDEEFRQKMWNGI